MTCNKCNTSLMDNFLYCPFCGQKQKVRTESEVELIQELGGFRRGDRVLIRRGGSGMVLALVPAGERIPPIDAAVVLPIWIKISDLVKTYKQSYISKKDRALVLLDTHRSRAQLVNCESLDQLGIEK